MFVVSFGVINLAMGLVVAERLNITIGTIVADKWVLPFAIYRTGPAIEMGVEKLREIVANEADITFKLYVSEACTADKVGAFAAEMYYVANVSAFIGPGTYDFTFVILDKYMHIHVSEFIGHDKYVFVFIIPDKYVPVFNGPDKYAPLLCRG
jgi:hypothetical protein